MALLPLFPKERSTITSFSSKHQRLLEPTSQSSFLPPKPELHCMCSARMVNKVNVLYKSLMDHKSLQKCSTFTTMTGKTQLFPTDKTCKVLLLLQAPVLEENSVVDLEVDSEVDLVASSVVGSEADLVVVSEVDTMEDLEVDSVLDLLYPEDSAMMMMILSLVVVLVVVLVVDTLNQTPNTNCFPPLLLFAHKYDEFMKRIQRIIPSFSQELSCMKSLLAIKYLCDNKDDIFLK